MLIADCANSIIGCITPPQGVVPLPAVGPDGDVSLGPIILLLNLVFKLVFIGGGLFGFLNLLAAGFGFMNAGGDAKAVSAAWNKIQQTFLGLVILVSSFLLAAIMGQIIFGNPTYFLQPSLTLQ